MRSRSIHHEGHEGWPRHRLAAFGGRQIDGADHEPSSCSSILALTRPAFVPFVVDFEDHGRDIVEARRSGRL